MTDSGVQEAWSLLRRGLKVLDLGIPEERLALLVSYCLDLEKWNRRVNLIAKNTPLADIVEKHFLDSLILVPVLDTLQPLGGILLDVGSGAGFPGLPLKIARPEWDITLLEPRERRVIFLRHVIRTLRLERICVEPSRIEEGRLTGPFQVITGRAVADVPAFLAMVETQADADTRIICMQGEGGSQGLRPGDRIGTFVCTNIEIARLPFSQVPRYLLLFRRTGA